MMRLMKRMSVGIIFVGCITAMAQPRMQTPGFFDTNVVISAGPQTNSTPKDNATAKLLSGFYGQTIEVQGVTSAERAASEVPVKRDVLVFDSTGKLVHRIVTNPVGQFYSFVNDGNYTLVAIKTSEQFTSKTIAGLPQNLTTNAVKITVTSNRLTKADIRFQGDR